MGDEEKELLEYIKKNRLNRKGRHRELIDKKAYLIGYLYHFWFYTEDKIAKIFNVERTTVNHHKSKIFDLKKDPSFLRNTVMERELYPIEEDSINVFKEMEEFQNTLGYGMVFVKLHREEYLKLKTFIQENNITNPKKLLPELINKLL
jgi:hypothetical protein